MFSVFSGGAVMQPDKADRMASRNNLFMTESGKRFIHGIVTIVLNRWRQCSIGNALAMPWLITTENTEGAAYDVMPLHFSVGVNQHRLSPGQATAKANGLQLYLLFPRWSFSKNESLCTLSSLW